ncbi:MAG: Flp pilus assembly protein CpaB [Methylobacter sp.]|nr:Flp pilus assembly protein CpaB [Methylobacter sp.]
MSSSVLRVFAVILAIGAITIGYFGYQASKQPLKPEPVPVEAAEPKGETVVFAVRDIPAGQVIGEEDLTMARVPTRPVRSYTASADLIGRKSKIDISSGEMVLPRHFPSYSRLALSLHPGERAVAVKVDEVIGAGGFIEPDDQVDVLLYLQADQESSAQVVLSKVRVLAFGNILESQDEQTAADGDAQSPLLEKAKTGGTKAAAGKREKEEEPTGKKSKTAVLAIAESDTSTLMLAESSGKIRLALHGAEREENALGAVEAGLVQAAFSPSGLEDGGKDKHYIVLKELIQNGAVKQEAETKSGGGEEEARVIVHRGSRPTETWTRTLKRSVN